MCIVCGTIDTYTRKIKFLLLIHELIYSVVSIDAMIKNLCVIVVMCVEV